MSSPRHDDYKAWTEPSRVHQFTLKEIGCGGGDFYFLSAWLFCETPDETHTVTRKGIFFVNELLLLMVNH